MNKVHYSSNKDGWETPDDLFWGLNKKYKFTLDVCALKKNAKCERYFTPRQNGLEQSWANEVCWMNPPYGREISDWMAKAAHEAAHNNATVVCLVPARTDTKWWHNAVNGTEAGEWWDGEPMDDSVSVFYLRGRLKFKGAKHCAPFPSAIIVFHPRKDW